MSSSVSEMSGGNAPEPANSRGSSTILVNVTMYMDICHDIYIYDIMGYNHDIINDILDDILNDIINDIINDIKCMISYGISYMMLRVQPFLIPLKTPRICPKLMIYANKSKTHPLLIPLKCHCLPGMMTDIC
jgi:hypothetical protein